MILLCLNLVFLTTICICYMLHHFIRACSSSLYLIWVPLVIDCNFIQLCVIIVILDLTRGGIISLWIMKLWSWMWFIQVWTWCSWLQLDLLHLLCFIWACPPLILPHLGCPCSGLQLEPTWYYCVIVMCIITWRHNFIMDYEIMKLYVGH